MKNEFYYTLKHANLHFFAEKLAAAWFWGDVSYIQQYLAQVIFLQVGLCGNYLYKKGDFVALLQRIFDRKLRRNSPNTFSISCRDLNSSDRYNQVVFLYRDTCYKVEIFETEGEIDNIVVSAHFKEQFKDIEFLEYSESEEFLQKPHFECRPTNVGDEFFHVESLAESVVDCICKVVAVTEEVALIDGFSFNFSETRFIKHRLIPLYIFDQLGLVPLSKPLFDWYNSTIDQLVRNSLELISKNVKDEHPSEPNDGDVFYDEPKRLLQLFHSAKRFNGQSPWNIEAIYLFDPFDLTYDWYLFGTDVSSMQLIERDTFYKVDKMVKLAYAYVSSRIKSVCACPLNL